MENKQVKKYNKIKYLKLVASITIDLIGYVTYVLPALGESADIGWGPISFALILILYPNRKLIALGGGLEELIPMTDFIPTALVAWWLEYIKDEEKTLTKYKNKEFMKNK